MTDRRRLHTLLDRVIDMGETRTAYIDIALRAALGELTHTEALLGMRALGVAESFIDGFRSGWAMLKRGQASDPE